MTDRPIIFSPLMVRALLDGRKTQTRRLVHREGETPFDLKPSPWQRVQPGDRLWVREAWSLTGEFADADAKYLRGFHSPERMLGRHLRYRAGADGYDEASQAWRPAIHMPRWASRLTLTVTATKIEQLQAISEADACAEGLSHTGIAGIAADEIEPAAECFARLWDELHGEGAWDANPKVVVLTFTVEKRNIDAPGAAA